MPQIADLPAAAVLDGTELLPASQGGKTVQATVAGVAAFGSRVLAAFTVATLPTPAAPWALALATDGRRSGEAAGAGTGCPVWFDGTAWRTFYDNTAVTA